MRISDWSSDVCSSDLVEIIFAGQPFLDDFEVEKAQKTAAKAKAERGACFHLEAEGRIVQPQLLDALAQLFKVVGVGREQAAEDDRLDLLEPGERRRGRPFRVGHRIADPRLGEDRKSTRLNSSH